MKVTFKRKNLEVSCECLLVSQIENKTITSITFKSEEMGIIDMWGDVIEESNAVLIYDEDDGVEFKIITSRIEKYENYAFIRINCN